MLSTYNPASLSLSLCISVGFAKLEKILEIQLPHYWSIQSCRYYLSFSLSLFLSLLHTYIYHLSLIHCNLSHTALPHKQSLSFYLSLSSFTHTLFHFLSYLNIIPEILILFLILGQSPLFISFDRRTSYSYFKIMKTTPVHCFVAKFSKCLSVPCSF